MRFRKGRIVKITFFCVLLFWNLCNNLLHSQKHDYNWLFGYGTGIIPDSANPFGGIIMSFNDGKIEFTTQAREFEFNYQTNSYSNASGKLLYMSNGCSLADSEAQILPNGDSLGYGKIWGVNCPKSQPLPQAGLFLHFENNQDTLIYLHTILDTFNGGEKAFLKCIYETKIDISNKSVISKNKIILYDTLYGNLMAVPTENYTKWWILVPKKRSNEYYILLYTQKGVEKVLRQQIGIEHIELGTGGSQGIFSPDGKRYAFYSSLNGLQVFDFNRTTGLLSNFRWYDITFPVNAISGCGFSPNSRFVYVSNTTEVIQVDLEELNSDKALDTVGVFDNFFDPYATTYKQMALGPDCRLYISTSGGNRYLHVIMHPDRKGKECMLINRGLKLPTRNANAIPNFPHYRVDEAYPCDSTIRIQLNTAVDELYKFKNAEIMLYPNPAGSELVLYDLHQKITGEIRIKIIDIHGRIRHEIIEHNTGQEISISLKGMESGLYFVRMHRADGKTWMDKFIKE